MDTSRSIRVRERQLSHSAVGGLHVRVSYGHSSKVLTPAEAAQYVKAGIDVVTIWEFDPLDALGGAAAGLRHATKAAQLRRECGGPSTAPIYFGADFEALPEHQGLVNDYLRAAASVIGKERVGVYGSYFLVKRCAEAGVAR